MRRCVSVFWILCFALAISISHSEETMPNTTILKGKKICIDPGHGGTAGKDLLRQGPTGEREEWVNLRVGLMLKELLEQAGAQVVITRTEDKEVELKARAVMAIQAHCDLFISIHHEGTQQDDNINYTMAFYNKDASQNPASVDFAKILVNHFQKALGLSPKEIFSDWTILPNFGTAVLRYSYPYMPGVIGEASFLTTADEEQRLKRKDYNQKEAQAYLEAIIEYFSKGIPTAELMEPKPEQPITQKRPVIQFQLNDGLGGKAIDSNSILVNWNGKYISKSYQAKTGIVTISPTEFSFGEQTVKLFAKNSNGQALHPIPFIFKTGGELAQDILSQKKQTEKPVLTLKLVVPESIAMLDDSSPIIKLGITDSHIAQSLDTASLEIYFNNRRIPYQYDAEHGQIVLAVANYLKHRTQNLQVYSAKDTGGREFTIVPAEFSINLLSAQTKEKMEYKTAFDKGQQIVERMTQGTGKKKLSAEDKETLLQGIDYLTRCIQVFPDSSIAGNAQYLIGVAFEKLADDPYYKQQAIHAYTLAVEYYPIFDTTPAARAALGRLETSTANMRE